MEPSQCKSPSFTISLAVHLLVGPAVGTLVLINIVKSDFSEGPATYLLWGYIVGLLPASLCAAINYVLLSEMFKHSKAISALKSVMLGSISRLVIGSVLYIGLRLFGMSFISYLLVFCIPSGICAFLTKLAVK